MAYTTKVESISKTSMEDIVLWAKYDLLVSSLYSPGEMKVTDGAEKDQPKFTVSVNLGEYWYEQIRGTNINKIQITFSLDIRKVDDGYQDFYLRYNGKTIWYNSMDHSGGSTYKRYTFSKEFNVEDYKDANYFELQFWAHGTFDDDWKFKNLDLKVKLIHSGK